jgi:hypothetical protein
MPRRKFNVYPFTTEASIPLPPPPPPAALGQAGREVWEKICAEFVLGTSGAAVLLEQACLALDRADAAGSVKEEMSCRTLATRLLLRLGVHTDPNRY